MPGRMLAVCCLAFLASARSGAQQAVPEDTLEQVTVKGAEAELEPARREPGVRSRFIWRIPEARGYADGTYAGSRLKSYQRLVVAPVPFASGALLATKDPGERRLNEFVSGNLILRAGPVSLVAGDYRIETGQGLVFWRAYGLAKGAQVFSPVYRSPRLLVESLSADEVSFLRGGAARYSRGAVDAVLFVSARTLPAASELLYGGAAVLSWSGNRAGIAAAHSRIAPDPAAGGGSQPAASLFADVGLSGTRVFGEIARAGAATGVLCGVLVTVSPSTRLLLAGRRFPPGFAPRHGLGFGDRLGGANETGVYLGLQHRFAPPWKCTAYVDRFWFPAPTAGNPFGAGGCDALLELARTPARVRLQWRSAVSSSGGTGLPGAASAATRTETAFRIRLEGDARLGSRLVMRTRFEKLFLAGVAGREEGTLFYDDIAADAAGPLAVSVRLTFFTSGSYASRLYAAERDLEGVLSMPPLSGTGSRWYLVVRWRPAARTAVSFKYAETVRDDLRYIGSGADRLPSNRDSQLGLQADWSF